MIRKVISGGQTGIDRAGLDAAQDAGIPIGGYCPKGRLAEDGTIPEKYPMIELNASKYSIRTEKNVIESDGTLILNLGDLTKGTKLTHEYTLQHARPSLIVQLDDKELIRPEHVVRWIEGQHISILNIAGPRESKVEGGIYSRAKAYLDQVFRHLKETI